MKIEIHDLTKCYRDKVACDHFTYDFTPGIYGLLGSNGAGKTTLMKLMTANLRPTEGEILWNGQDIRTVDREYRSHIGYMPQQQGNLGGLSVAGFLNEIGQMKGMSRRQIQKESVEMLERLNLADCRYKEVSALSGGMKQRVLLAQALMNSPDILILDEPTAGLDPRERIRIRNLLFSLAGKRIILIATHIVSDIEYIADQMIFMKDGRIVTAGSQEEVLAKVQPKVVDIPCERADLLEIQMRHPVGRILQEREGFFYRYIENHKESSEEEAAESKAVQAATMEDAYMYYILSDSVNTGAVSE